MTRRTKEAYVAVLRFIEAEVGGLKPASFMSDFEPALRSAIRTVYHCQTRGCYFHFTQAVRKNASQTTGFFDAVNNDTVMSRVYHKLLALPLLPKEQIVEGYDHCKEAASAFGDVFTSFLSYFYRQWILKVCT